MVNLKTQGSLQPYSTMERILMRLVNMIGRLSFGPAFTVTGVVTSHPVPREYVIVVTPAPIPVTFPLDEPTVPAAGLLLLHAPPATMSLKANIAPTHTVEPPVIPRGVVLTETVMLAAQPVGSV